MITDLAGFITVKSKKAIWYRELRLFRLLFSQNRRNYAAEACRSTSLRSGPPLPPPPGVMKQGGLKSSGWIVIFPNGKTKRRAYVSAKKTVICILYTDFSRYRRIIQNYLCLIQECASLHQNGLIDTHGCYVPSLFSICILQNIGK